MNRVLPEQINDPFFQEWRVSQQQILQEMDAYFAPLQPRRVPLFTHEVSGLERLRELSKVLYAEGEDPSAVTCTERPYRFEKIDGRYEVHLTMPFASKGEIGLFKKADELVVEVGTLRRHIGLPTSMAALSPGRARLTDRTLIIEMKETP